MKEHSPEADRGESKRVEGHMMKGSSLRTHMYWSALHYIVELHLLGLHREKCTKKLLVMSWWLPAAPQSANEQSGSFGICRLIQTQVEFR